MHLRVGQASRCRYRARLRRTGDHVNLPVEPAQTFVIVLMIVSFDRRDIAHPVMPAVVDECAPSMPGATANRRPLTQAKASIGSKSRTAA